MAQDLPSVGPDAGRLVTTGTVVGFDPHGIPLVTLADADALFLAGRHYDADLCDELA
jgi:hypothetical protein